MRWPLFLTVIVCAAGCGKDDPVPPVQACCEKAGVAASKQGACDTSVGEIEVPVARCSGVDAGNTCGNGKFEPAVEQCDTSASNAPACTMGTCMDCRCIGEVCGDGTVSGAEACETNAQCGSAGVVCRGCQCALRSRAVTFTDVAGDDKTVALGQNLIRVEMALKGDPRDEFRVVFGPIDGQVRPGLVEFCLVIRDASAEVQRFCFQDTDGTRAAFVQTGANRRTLATPGDFSVNVIDTGGVLLGVPPAVGLRFEPQLQFHWESLYDGALADRLPDTGEISFTELVGRE